MPDISTHFLFGIALALLINVKSREERYLVVIGSVMIDIERPLTVIARILDLKALKLSVPFHSLFGCFFLSITIASFFKLDEVENRKQVALLFLGGILHLLLDMSLFPWEEKGIFLLYPLKISFSFNLFWPGFLGYPLIGVIICLISIIVSYFINKKREDITTFLINELK